MKPKPRKRKPRTVTVEAWAVVDGNCEIRGLHTTCEHIGIVRALGCRIIKLTGKIEL